MFKSNNGWNKIDKKYSYKAGYEFSIFKGIEIRVAETIHKLSHLTLLYSLQKKNSYKIDSCAVIGLSDCSNLLLNKEK